MKAKREHRVPLCHRAMEILGEARTLDDGAGLLVFTRGGGKPLADRQLRQLLQQQEIAAVPHGFRSSFRDWAAEETDHPREVVEAALAHVVQNKVEAAYRRTDLFERRRKLMDDWGRLPGRRASRPGCRTGPLIRRALSIAWAGVWPAWSRARPSARAMAHSNRLRSSLRSLKLHPGETFAFEQLLDRSLHVGELFLPSVDLFPLGHLIPPWLWPLSLSMATENVTLLAIENVTLFERRRGGSGATGAGAPGVNQVAVMTLPLRSRSVPPRRPGRRWDGSPWRVPHGVASGSCCRGY